MINSLNQDALAYNMLAGQHNYSLIKQAESIINEANVGNDKCRNYITIQIGDNKPILLKRNERIKIKLYSLSEV